MLGRQEGRKEPRYTHLFCGEPDECALPDTGSERVGSGNNSRLETLELKVGELRSELQDLEQRFEKFTKQFE